MTGKPVFILFAVAASFALAACASASPASTPIPVPATATEPPAPTATDAPSATPAATDTAAPQPYVVYDFLQLACQASWSNNGQALECPGEQWHIIGPGYVGVIEDPLMEGNQQFSEPALLTHPSNEAGFYGIFGKYPTMVIKAGDEFKATVGCLYGVEAEACNATFAIDYFDAAGDYHPQFWTWQEANDGHLGEITVNLSPLAGQTVHLVLAVRDNGDSAGDYTVWLHPQLWRLP